MTHGAPPRAILLRRITWILIAASAAARGWFATTLPLSGDETYHWEWSRRLEWAYHDHPGLTAWLIRGSTELFGTTPFAVRLPALVCLTITWIALAALTRDVARQRGADPEATERTALIAVLIAQFAPILAVFSIYISTDPPLIACWTLSLWLGHRAITRGRWMDWIGTGLAFGLAANSKFVAGLLVPSALLFVVLARRDTGIRSCARPAAAIAVAAALAVPVVLWNAANDWSTFHFNLVSRQDVVEARWFDPPVYALGQALALSPVLFVMLLLGVFHAWRLGRTRGDRSAWFLFAFSAVPLAAFLWSSFERAVSPHWPTVAWIAAIAHFAAEQRDGASFARPLWTRRAIVSAAAITLLIVGIAQVPQRYLDYDVAWFGRPRKIRVKALAERYGWQELGAAVAATRVAVQAEGDREVFLAATRYGLAASTSFYTPGQPQVHLWCTPRHHGDHYRFWDDWDELRGQNAILVVKRRVEGELPALAESFDTVAPPEELQIRDPAAPDFVIRSFWLVRCYGFRGELPFIRKWPVDWPRHEYGIRADLGTAVKRSGGKSLRPR